MLEPELIKLVEELLASGKFSQRAIALRTGICRWTVAAIAKGRRRADFPEPQEPVTSELTRCPKCGAKVLLPCRTCLIRKYRQQTLAYRRWKTRDSRTIHQAQGANPGSRGLPT